MDDRVERKRGHAKRWKRRVRACASMCEQVKGQRLDTDGAIRTRSRAAVQAEQWAVVSANAKIFMLLADMLIEAREGALPRTFFSIESCGDRTLLTTPVRWS